MQIYNTLPEAIAGLRQRGFTEDFNLFENSLQCRRAGIEISADEFEISEYYRFDINTDPDDESIVYGINSEKYGLKGTLVNSYSIYADSTASEILKKFKI